MNYSLSRLISVSTTTSKPPGVIKADLRKVLDRMQVQYRETRSGFECIHAPSIDITSVQSGHLNSSRKSQQTHEGPVRRSLTKKASKLSFGLKGKEKEKDSMSANLTATESTTRSESINSSLYNVSSNAHTIKAEPHTNDVTTNNQLDTTARTDTKNLPPIPRDFAPPPPSPSPANALPTGEIADDVFEALGSSTLCVRFEVNIVKVRFHYHIYLPNNINEHNLGSLAPLIRYPIPTDHWRWVAIPDACTTSSYRTEAMTLARLKSKFVMTWVFLSFSR